jgi:hypothetical protein
MNHTIGWNGCHIHKSEWVHQAVSARNKLEIPKAILRSAKVPRTYRLKAAMQTYNTMRTDAAHDEEKIDFDCVIVGQKWATSCCCCCFVFMTSAGVSNLESPTSFHPALDVIWMFHV